MNEFSFEAPTTLADALVALDEPGTLLVGGGTSLAVMIRSGLIEPTRLVSVGHVAELGGLDEHDGGLRIGATTTLHQLSTDERVRRLAPSLAEAAGQVGNPRVRSVATLGGALCHGDPRQDVPPVLLANGGTVDVVGTRGARSIPIEEFFTGFLSSAVEEDEIIVAVNVPRQDGLRSHYARFTPNSADDYPTVGVAVALGLDASGAVDHLRIGLGGVGETAILVSGAAAELVGSAPSPETIAAAATAAANACEPSGDSRGSADYKRAMVEVIVRRSIEACLA